MKRFSIAIFTISLLCVGILFSLPRPSYATQVQQFGGTPVVPTPASVDGWAKDSTVTFLGKGVIRAKEFMDWTLTNYKWSYTDAPITNSWKTIRNIVYTMSILAVLVTGFLVIIKGEDVGVMVFIKEFIIALVAVTFSYALARLLFQIADIFQLFFFQTAGTTGGIITSKDLINISFSPQNFIGYRKVGISYDESASISLLLVQLSTITFYIIGSILTIRKIILWFFLISSPLYPILLIYKGIRNTGKIWIKELLRWLLYAPLFALFLSAVVIIWKSNILVLPFHFGSSANTYPTAINILVGGPGQVLSLTNSLNYSDTFAQYVIALIMLWVAIIMPFILLQIILEFLAKHEFGVNSINGLVNTLRTNVANNNISFLKKPTQPSPSPVGQFPGGLARKLPKYQNTHEETTTKHNTIETASQKTSGMSQTSHMSHSQMSNISNQHTTNQSQHNNTSEQHQVGQHTNYTTNATNTTNSTNTTSTTNANNIAKGFQHVSQFTSQPTMTTQLKPEIMAKQTPRMISFSIPNMRDIVKFETARLSNTQTNTSELHKTEESLKKIANPKASSDPIEEEHFILLQDQLNQETAKGDILAESILSAATIEEASEAKDGELQVPTELPVVNLPTVNQIQTVSFDDYEVVKALWLENYQQIDIPDQYSNRILWIEDDIQAVSQTITLLSSSDPDKVKEGLSLVSDILPFLLIGGFSQSEVIAYLKAKSTAAKSALAELVKKEESQDTLLKKGAQKAASKQLSQEAEIPKNEAKT